MSVYGNNIVPINERTCYTGDGIMIGVYGGETDRGLSLNPYFKVYNSDTQTKATKVARIYFSMPVYCTHHKRGPDANKDRWIFNSKEMKKFLAIVNDDKNWANMNEELSIIIQKQVFYPRPDYSKLVTEESLKR